MPKTNTLILTLLFIGLNNCGAQMPEKAINIVLSQNGDKLSTFKNLIIISGVFFIGYKAQNLSNKLLTALNLLPEVSTKTTEIQETSKNIKADTGTIKSTTDRIEEKTETIHQAILDESRDFKLKLSEGFTAYQNRIDSLRKIAENSFNEFMVKLENIEKTASEIKKDTTEINTKSTEILDRITALEQKPTNVINVQIVHNGSPRQDPSFFIKAPKKKKIDSESAISALTLKQTFDRQFRIEKAFTLPKQ